MLLELLVALLASCDLLICMSLWYQQIISGRPWAYIYLCFCTGKATNLVPAKHANFLTHSTAAYILHVFIWSLLESFNNILAFILLNPGLYIFLKELPKAFQTENFIHLAGVVEWLHENEEETWSKLKQVLEEQVYKCGWNTVKGIDSWIMAGVHLHY